MSKVIKSLRKEPRRNLWNRKNLRGDKMRGSVQQNSVREVWSGMTKAADKREAGQVAACILGD